VKIKMKRHTLRRVKCRLVVVWAVQWDGTARHWDEILENTLASPDGSMTPSSGIGKGPQFIKIKGNTRVVREGDWIVQRQLGGVFFLDDSVFTDLYVERKEKQDGT